MESTWSFFTWQLLALCIFLFQMVCSDQMTRLRFSTTVKKPFALYYGVQLVTWLIILEILAISGWLVWRKGPSSRGVSAMALIATVMLLNGITTFTLWSIRVFVIVPILNAIAFLLLCIAAGISNFNGSTSTILQVLCLPWLAHQTVFYFYFWRKNSTATITRNLFNKFGEPPETANANAYIMPNTRVQSPEQHILRVTDLDEEEPLRHSGEHPKISLIPTFKRETV
jgi:hypothetical protein